MKKLEVMTEDDDVMSSRNRKISSFIALEGGNSREGRIQREI